nr:apolipoprotein N-acyltransferase [Sphingomonas arenae]
MTRAANGPAPEGTHAHEREHWEHSRGSRGRLNAALALLLGLISAFAFQPVGMWPLMPLAFAALAELIGRTRSLKAALFVGWSFGVGQFVLGLNWIATAFTYQAAMPAWLGWIAVVLLSLYLAIYPAMATGLAWRFGQRSRMALVLSLAGGWAVTEYLRALVFTGFAWNPVGVVLVETAWLNSARFAGTYALSALVVLLGGGLFLLAHRRWRRGAALLIPALLLLILPPAEESGYLTNFGPPNGRAEGAAIRIIQPNIGQQDKYRPGASEEAARRLAGLSSRAGGERPRLIFWPEAAITEPLEDARTGEHQAFARFERTRAASVIGPGEYLLTGGIAVHSPDGRRVTGAANSVFALDGAGTVRGRYDKSHLVPYGEYLPMRPLLSAIGLSRLVPGDVDFNPGPGPRSFDLPGWGKVGLQVCYEIIFSGQVVDPRERPRFIFNPSNDAWFGAWGPPQHLAQARLRAAEEGLPVVRSTPTGISALIDARGKLLASLPLGTAGVIDARLPPSAEATPFARLGNWLPMLLAFGLLITAIVLDARRRYRAEI